MMGGLLFRYRLACRRWITSLFGILVIGVSFAAANLIQNLYSRNPDIASAFYEQEGLLLAAVIMSWSLSLDYDSGFIRQIFTYPQHRLGIIAERGLLGYGLFILIMSALTLYYQQTYGIHVWSILLFMLPVYGTIGALVTLGTLLTQHSLLGLLFGLLFWMLPAMGMNGLEYSPIILHFSSVLQSAGTLFDGEHTPWDGWVVYNRLFYLGITAVVWVLTFALFLLPRKR